MALTNPLPWAVEKDKGDWFIEFITSRKKKHLHIEEEEYLEHELDLVSPRTMIKNSMAWTKEKRRECGFFVVYRESINEIYMYEPIATGGAHSWDMVYDNLGEYFFKVIGEFHTHTMSGLLRPSDIDMEQAYAASSNYIAIGFIRTGWVGVWKVPPVCTRERDTEFEEGWELKPPIFRFRP